MQSKRRAKRRPFERLAWAHLDREQPARSCTLQNISAGGARLLFPGPVDVPEEFILYFAGDKSVARRCRVKWWSGETSEVGVEFLARLVVRKRPELEVLSC